MLFVPQFLANQGPVTLSLKASFNKIDLKIIPTGLEYTLSFFLSCNCLLTVFLIYNVTSFEGVV